MQQEHTALLGKTQNYSFCFGQETGCVSPETLPTDMQSMGEYSTLFYPFLSYPKLSYLTCTGV